MVILFIFIFFSKKFKSLLQKSLNLYNPLICEFYLVAVVKNTATKSVTKVMKIMRYHHKHILYCRFLLFINQGISSILATHNLTLWRFRVIYGSNIYDRGEV